MTSPTNDWFGNGNGSFGAAPSPSNWYGQAYYDVGELTGTGPIVGEAGAQPIIGDSGGEILGE